MSHWTCLGDPIWKLTLAKTSITDRHNAWLGKSDVVAVTGGDHDSSSVKCTTWLLINVCLECFPRLTTGDKQLAVGMFLKINNDQQNEGTISPATANYNMRLIREQRN